MHYVNDRNYVERPGRPVLLGVSAFKCNTVRLFKPSAHALCARYRFSAAIEPQAPSNAATLRENF